MVDNSTLREMKKQFILNILSTMHNALDVYFDSDNREDCESASQTINRCKNLLNDINF